MVPSAAGEPPLLSGVVVHWHNEDELERLVAAWPATDPRFELVVVDNGSRRALDVGTAHYLRAGSNLGFAGGINRGVAAARGDLLLLLNPDACPLDDALERLLEGFEAHPEAAGLAPRLEGPDGQPQWRWQLRPLPTATALLAQTLLLPGVRPLHREPAAASAVEQPAAAVLALRRRALAEIGGLDEGFRPAWFEDVDLARRLHDAGELLLYWPTARFRHDLGGSVPALGYGRFLWIYYRSLGRYLGKHHGRAAALAARVTLTLGLAARLLLLPLRRPRRAASRLDAARGLGSALAGALTGWRRPRRWARATETDG